MRIMSVRLTGHDGIQIFRLHHQKNEEGKKHHLYVGKDPDTGRNTYALPAKAITEILDWFDSPMKVLGRKSAPVVQMMVEAMFDRGGLSQASKEQKTIGGYLKRYESPIGIDTKSSFLHTFPKSFGMNKSAIIDMMQRGYESGNMDLVGSAMGWAVENNFDAKTLQGIAYRNYKTGIKKAALQ